MTLAERQTNELVIYEDPTAVLARAKQWATSLMDVVETQDMSAMIGKKRYLEVEAWQLVGEYAGAHAIARAPTRSTLLIGDDEIDVYECTADLFDSLDRKIGEGTMSCGLDAFPCEGKTGTEKHKAAKSAAQTWAISKAYRNKFGFVAKLAGFEGTTAEEMRGSSAERTVTDPMMLCPIHNVEWFKRGRMRQSAHPVEGEVGPRNGAVWCNQDDVMGELGDRLRAALRANGHAQDAVAKEWSERWGSMNPAERYNALVGLEKLVDGESSGAPPVNEGVVPEDGAADGGEPYTEEELSPGPICGLCSKPMGDEGGAAHGACMDADDENAREAENRS